MSIPAKMALKAGLARARSKMFEALAEALSTGRCNPNAATIALIDEIVEQAFAEGVEAKADSVQPEFARLQNLVAEFAAASTGSRRN